MAEIKKISVGGVTYDIKDEKARTIAENPMLPVAGILDAQGGTDVTSKATSHRGIFYTGNGVFKAKSISNDTDFHTTWDAYDYNNVHYPASDVYASRGGAFSNALYLMEGSLYRIQAGAMVQVIQGSAGEGGELGEDVSIVKSGTSYVFGNGAVVGQNAQLNGTLATGANVGEGAKVGKSTNIGEGAVIHGGVKIGTSKTGHGGVYINSDVNVDKAGDGATWIGKDVTIGDNATISVEMLTDDAGNPYEQGSYLLGNNTEIGRDAMLGGGIEIDYDGENYSIDMSYATDKTAYIGKESVVRPKVYVGDNAKIGDQVEIGKQVYIEEGFSVDEGAITTTGGILNLTGKGKQSTIGGSVNIGEGIQIKGDEEKYNITLAGEDSSEKATIGKNIFIGSSTTIGGGVSIADVIIKKNSSGDLSIGAIGATESFFNTLGRRIHIGSSTFIDTGDDRGLFLICSRQDIRFGTNVGSRKTFFKVDESSLSIGSSKIKFVAAELPELTIGSGYLSWNPDNVVRLCGGSVSLGTAASTGDPKNIRIEGNMLIKSKLNLGTAAYLEIGTNSIAMQQDTSTHSRIEIEGGYLKVYSKGKWSNWEEKFVRIPLNNQTIGAVSDETISV